MNTWILDIFVFIFRHMWAALSDQLDQLLSFCFLRRKRSSFSFSTAASQLILITVMAEGGKLFSCSATKCLVKNWKPPIFYPVKAFLSLSNSMNKNCLGGPGLILLSGGPEGPRWTFAWQDPAYWGSYGAPLNPVRRTRTVLAIISMQTDAYEACMSTKFIHMLLSNVCTYNQFKILLWMKDLISHKCNGQHVWCSFHDGNYIFYFILLDRT